MSEFVQQIADAANDALALVAHLSNVQLDYSGASLAVVEDTLGEVAGWEGELTPEQLQNLARAIGCYILEVARREFGGRYCWYEDRDAPVPVVGEPQFRLALLTWDRVRSRLSGDPSDNIPFFYAGFAERARRAEPGTDALYV